MKRTLLLAFGACLAGTGAARAQFTEDALRYTNTNGYITPRAGVFGTAYHGVADDFAALFYNPAGLTLLPKNEISLGLGFNRFSTESNFLNTKSPFASNTTTVTHAGFSAPFTYGKTRVAVSVGYALESDFENSNRFGAFNPGSSIVSYFTKLPGANFNNSFAVDLFLADTLNGRLVTPIQDSVEQTVFLRESGGLHAVSGGAAFDLSENVSMGGSIVVRRGNYSYHREYEERDVLNRYDVFNSDLTNVDFASLKITDDIRQEVEGIGGTIGLQARVAEFLRLGVSVKTPTFYTVSEDFSREGQTTFDNGDVRPSGGAAVQSGSNSYNIRTPWVFGGGVSVHALGFTFSAGAEYQDVTQLEFSDESFNSSKDFNGLNRSILESLVGQTSWGVGVEYEVPATPFIARAGYTNVTSPYQADIAGATARIASLGGGMYLAPNIRLDGIMRWTQLSQQRVNYETGGAASVYTVKQTPLNIGLQLTYRY